MPKTNPEADPRTEEIQVLVSPEVKARLAERAARNGLDLEDYVRMMLYRIADGRAVDLGSVPLDFLLKPTK